ncbi:Rap guanine nucleotide exchange factor [Dirofilaria immitis]
MRTPYGKELSLQLLAAAYSSFIDRASPTLLFAPRKKTIHDRNYITVAVFQSGDHIFYWYLLLSGEVQLFRSTAKMNHVLFVQLKLSPSIKVISSPFIILQSSRIGSPKLQKKT